MESSIEQTLREYEQLVDTHRLNKLKEMAKQYNSLPTITYNYNVVKFENLTGKFADIEEYSNAEDYIFAFFMRKVKIPTELGFGEEYDEELMGWFHLPDIENPDWRLESCEFYNMYKADDFLLRSFLLFNGEYYTASGPSKINKVMQDKLDKITRKEFVHLLKSSSHLDNFCLLLNLENWGIVKNIFDYLDFINATKDAK